jgi:hypothetical protein
VDPITLVVTFSDSVTGEVVHRMAIMDKPIANRLMPQTATHYWEHLRKLFRRLATRIRWQLADPSNGPIL